MLDLELISIFILTVDGSNISPLLLTASLFIHPNEQGILSNVGP